MAKGNIASLTENRDFQRAYRKAAPVYGKYIVLYVRQNNCDCIRFGITATKKIGKACKRNRARRLVFECFRMFYPDIFGSKDIVIVCKNTMLDVTYAALYEEMHRLLTKAGLYDE